MGLLFVPRPDLMLAHPAVMQVMEAALELPCSYGEAHRSSAVPGSHGTAPSRDCLAAKQPSTPDVACSALTNLIELLCAEEDATAMQAQMDTSTLPSAHVLADAASTPLAKVNGETKGLGLRLVKLRAFLDRLSSLSPAGQAPAAATRIFLLWQNSLVHILHGAFEVLSHLAIVIFGNGFHKHHQAPALRAAVQECHDPPFLNKPVQSKEPGACVGIASTLLPAAASCVASPGLHPYDSLHTTSCKALRPLGRQGRVCRCVNPSKS
eukprot:360874-Chlamydomonas_euryale.AAC.19